MERLRFQKDIPARLRSRNPGVGPAVPAGIASEDVQSELCGVMLAGVRL
ncbi:MAG: hypothetical protein ACHRXM_02760 [Isosphaerales bacterium]